MAAQPINPLSRPAASILGFQGNPSEELKNDLAERRKKAMLAARLQGGVGDLLAGNPAVGP